MHHRLRVKPKTVKLLEEIIGEKPCDFKVRERFLRYDTENKKTHERKVGKLDFNKIKICCLKDTFRRMKN